MQSIKFRSGCVDSTSKDWRRERGGRGQTLSDPRNFFGGSRYNLDPLLDGDYCLLDRVPAPVLSGVHVNVGQLAREISQRASSSTEREGK